MMHLPHFTQAGSANHLSDRIPREALAPGVYSSAPIDPSAFGGSMPGTSASGWLATGWLASWKVALLALVLVVLGGCAGGPLSREPGLHTRQMDYQSQGIDRSYKYYLPRSYQDGQALGNDSASGSKASMPLVVVIHGAFSKAADMVVETGFNELSDQHEFVVAYPEGIGIFGMFQHWNAGHCCGKANDDDIDDVAYILAIVQELQETFALEDEFYLVGTSNGGMMAYRVASQHPDRVRALAAVAAAVGSSAPDEPPTWKLPRAASPVPLIVFHGKLDDTLAYDGGVTHHQSESRQYTSVDQGIEHWLACNHCNPEPEVTTTRGDAVQIKRWHGPAGSAPVELHTLETWGHYWPGKYWTDALDDDDPLKGYDAAPIIWQFFDKVTQASDAAMTANER